MQEQLKSVNIKANADEQAVTKEEQQCSAWIGCRSNLNHCVYLPFFFSFPYVLLNKPLLLIPGEKKKNIQPFRHLWNWKLCEAIQEHCGYVEQGSVNKMDLLRLLWMSLTSTRMKILRLMIASWVLHHQIDQKMLEQILKRGEALILFSAV